MQRTTADILSDLVRLYEREQVGRERYGILVRELSDVPPEVLERAVRQVARTSEFFPTLAAIRSACAELVLDLPSESAALAQVEARMRWGRADEDARGDPPRVHPLVKAALDHVGGYYAFKSADEPAVVRGQFLRLYRSLRADAVGGLQTGDMAALGQAARAALPPAA